MTLINRAKSIAVRLARVGEGSKPTPSLQVMARDASRLIEELVEALGAAQEGPSTQPDVEPEAPAQEEEQEEPKPAPRRGRKPKAQQEEPPAEGDDA